MIGLDDQEAPPSDADRAARIGKIVDDLVDVANHLRYVARHLEEAALAERLHNVAESVEIIAKTVR